jgi:hypothetical protein
MKKILAVICLLSFVSLGMSQGDKKKTDGKARPDFSGTWAIDKSKSDFGRAENSPIAKADVVMTVTQSEQEFHVTRKMSLNGKERSGDWAYYTDGRGETNPMLLRSNVQLKTKTKWSGSKLVSKAAFSETVAGEDENVDIEERWEISGDGKTLTDTFSMSGSGGGTRAVKLVYKRAPEQAAMPQK